MSEGFSDNAGQKRFELKVGDHTAIANYRRIGTELFIDFVEAPPELRGTGAAGRLMENIVEFAEREKLKIVPICGYAASWLQKKAGVKNPSGGSCPLPQKPAS